MKHEEAGVGVGGDGLFFLLGLVREGKISAAGSFHRKKNYFMKTDPPSYVPPPCALPRDGCREFERAVSAAMLRGSGCGWRALRRISAQDSYCMINVFCVLEERSGRYGHWRPCRPRSASCRSLHRPRSPFQTPVERQLSFSCHRVRTAIEAAQENSMVQSTGRVEQSCGFDPRAEKTCDGSCKIHCFS
jgi:hypothetical protein